ncbi:MAG: hypothetical protein OEV21_00320 [Thermoplasmata archaeon]|nr:hypothetical protein [Thermoplasmata archaeon]
MNDEISAYLSSLERRLYWMDRKKRKDVVMEVNSHLSERVSQGESPKKAIESFGSARSVASSYLRVYGFGIGFISMLIVIGAALAIFTVPGVFLQSSEFIGIDWISLGFLAAAIALILISSFNGGRRAGVAVGLSECVMRFIVLGVLYAQGSIIVQDATFGLIGFIAVSIILPLIGYLSSVKPRKFESEL